MTVVGERHLGLSLNEEFARVPPELLLPLSGNWRKVGVEDTRTPWPTCAPTRSGLPSSSRVEAETGLPVLDSVPSRSGAAWRRRGGPLDARWGRLLTRVP
jgi:maleate isomerase